MISFFLNFALPVLIFIRVLAYLLYQHKNSDLLIRLAWQAFAITLPFAAFLSLAILQEPFLSFFRRVFFTAFLFFSMWLIRFIAYWLPRPIKYLIRYLSAVISDCIVFITFIFIYRSECWHLSRVESLGSGNIPVLFIHGYRHDAGAWVSHRPSLAAAGYGPLFTIDLGSPMHSIEEYAERVKLKSQRIGEITGSKELILVGFSMGGLVAAYYALHLAREGSVKGVITLGSPFDGTRMAMFGEGESAREFHYRTPFVRSLKERLAACSSIPFSHIGSRVDPLIRPTSSAWMTGGQTQKIILEEEGHLTLIYSEKVRRTLSECLDQLR